MGADGDPDLIRIETELGSIDDLVARGAPLIDGDVVSVGPGTAATPGERRRFQLVLADGTVALDGVGEVIGAARPWEPSGVRLRIVELDAASRAVHGRILAARVPIPQPRGAKLVPPPWRREGLPLAPVPAPAPALAPVPAPVPAPAAAAVDSAAVDSAAADSAAAAAAVDAAAAAAAADSAAAAADSAAAGSAAAADSTAAAATAVAAAPWTPPPWLRSRRAQIALAVAALILLIGIVAAFTADGADRRRPHTTVAATTPPASDDLGAPSPSGGGAPAPSGPALPLADVDAGAEPEVATPDDEAPPSTPPAETRHDAPATRPHHDRPAKRTSSSRPASSSKKSTAKRSVRLSVRSDPAGATILVDGEDASRGPVMVKAGSTVKVSATKRGYKRVTRSVKVGNGSSIVIKLQKM